MSDLASAPFRLARTLVVTALCAALTWAGSSDAWASGSTVRSNGSSPASQSQLQLEAQTLASQIQADGVQLDQLSAQFNAAQIRFQQLSAQTSLLRIKMRDTGFQVAVARQALREQAILAYMAGGAPILNFVPGEAGKDPSLTDAYAEIIAGGQKTAVRDLRSLLSQQSAVASNLAADSQQASVALSDIRTDQASANATLHAQQVALSQVKGQLAVLVAQVQASNQQNEQASVQKNLAGQGQTLPTDPTSGPVGKTSPTSVGDPPPTSPVTRGSTTSDPSPSSTAVTTTTIQVPTGGATTTTTTIVPETTTITTVPFNNTPAPGSQVAIAYARQQIGVPYLWGGASPKTGFDCSGLVMMAWAQAGVYFPHLAQDQYDLTERIPISDLLPGDLVFYGTPDDVYHVGLYIGGGDMIDAPTTGQDVSVQSIYYDGLLGGGRVES
jgi:cell wall-associated NlpC family hydrolase